MEKSLKEECDLADGVSYKCTEIFEDKAKLIASFLRNEGEGM